ncbi:MAG: J domain-containing protein [Rhodospirillales bacterium]
MKTSRHRTRLRIDAAEAPAAAIRMCDHPECAAMGEFRAPMSRDNLNQYYWFCLDHVREYNKAWNYYAGMSDDEVEASRRRDVSWDRPTWPLGLLGATGRSQRFHFLDDPFRLFPEDGETRIGGDRHSDSRLLKPEEKQALDTLGLKAPVTRADVKLRYRELAKKYHPDLNGGDRIAEERLKRINQAYNTLVKSLSS